jgi:hypothetical protein
MYKVLGSIVLLGAFVATPCFAQDQVIFDAAGTALVPLTDPIEINLDVVADGMEGSNDVHFTHDFKIIVSWEDDPSGVEAGMRFFDFDEAAGTITNIPWAADFEGNNVSSFYYDDGSPTHDTVGWGPKAKTNWFGPGFGMGAVCYPEDIASVAETYLDVGGGGSVGLVQLYEADGTPIIPVRCGTTDELNEPEGGGRIGDWDYLSNGNIVIITENRQEEDNVTKYGLDAPGKTIEVAILGPDDQFPNKVIKGTESTGSCEMWHGSAALANGFCIRFRSPAGVTLRYFDNEGNPTTGDIVLEGVMAQGGRGDGEGMNSNGNDRIVVVTKHDDDGTGTREIYAAVYDDLGNLVTGPVNVSEGHEFNNTDRTKCAIGPDGSFACIWDDDELLLPDKVCLGRVMNPDGTFATPVLSMDNRYDPVANDQPGSTHRPKITWRGNKIAAGIESSNRGEDPRSLAVRVFQYGPAGVEDWSLH